MTYLRPFFCFFAVCLGYTNCGEIYKVYNKLVSANLHWEEAFSGCLSRGAQLASFQTVEKFDLFLNLCTNHSNSEFGENF